MNQLGKKVPFSDLIHHKPVLNKRPKNGKTMQGVKVMAKGNENRGGLMYLAAVMMRVVAEDCKFMLHLAQWNCRLPTRDSPASSPSLQIVGQVSGKQTNLNRSSLLDLTFKQTCNLLLAITNAGGRSGFTIKVWHVEGKSDKLMVSAHMYDLSSTNSKYQSSFLALHYLLKLGNSLVLGSEAP